jgi:hypothetical protein
VSFARFFNNDLIGLFGLITVSDIIFVMSNSELNPTFQPGDMLYKYSLVLRCMRLYTPVGSESLLQRFIMDTCQALPGFVHTQGGSSGSSSYGVFDTPSGAYPTGGSSTLTPPWTGKMIGSQESVQCLEMNVLLSQPMSEETVLFLSDPRNYPIQNKSALDNAGAADMVDSDFDDEEPCPRVEFISHDAIPVEDVRVELCLEAAGPGESLSCVFSDFIGLYKGNYLDDAKARRIGLPLLVTNMSMWNAKSDAAIQSLRSRTHRAIRNVALQRVTRTARVATRSHPEGFDESVSQFWSFGFGW